VGEQLQSFKNIDAYSAEKMEDQQQALQGLCSFNVHANFFKINGADLSES
jgi:hypothetical protein